MTDNRLTVGQLKELVAAIDAPDDTVVAVECCNSSTCVHVLQAGTFISTYSPGFTFSLDPKGRQTDEGTMFVFSAESDYVGSYGDDEGDEDEDVAQAYEDFGR